MSADKGKSIRALIDTLEKIPAERFGSGRARILRKFVLVAIAKHADADGSNAMPSTATLARMCLVSERAIRETVAWLKEHGLLRVEYKAGQHGCNRYAIQFPTPGTGVPGDDDVPGTDVPRERPSHPEQFARDPEIENDILPSLDRKEDTMPHSAVLCSAIAAYRKFQTSMSKQDSLHMLRWILYRAAHPTNGGVPQVPQTTDYYLKAWKNFESEDEFGSENVLAGAEDRFDKHARAFLAEKHPELVAWIDERADECFLDELADTPEAASAAASTMEWRLAVSTLLA